MLDIFLVYYEHSYLFFTILTDQFLLNLNNLFCLKFFLELLDMRLDCLPRVKKKFLFIRILSNFSYYSIIL